MAWRWVNALELLDGTYFYLADPSRSYNDVASYYESIGGSSVTEAALGIAEAARTEAYIDARSNINTAAFGTYRYLLKNGIIIETNKTGSTSSCSWTLKIFDINNNYLAGINSTSNLPYYPLLCGVLVVDDDAERAYFGRCLYNRNTGTGRAVVTYAIEQSESVSNLYTLLKDAIPGGGGGSGPYVTDDYDEPIGGNDDPDDTSDTILEDALPTIGATISGLCTAYVPTIPQMQALANRLVDPTWYQALGNTVLDISDAVIGLQVLPFVVPSTLSQNQWKLNFLGISLPSGVYLNKANQQFCEIPCGTIHVTPYWNNCLDYNPYTQISVFLPFCGFFELDTDDVMDHDLEIKYRVDIMSGACLATIKVDGSVMYQFAGECSNQIPVSSVSFDNFLQSAMQLAITTASGSIGLAAAGASTTMQKEKIAMSEMSASDKQLADDAVNTDLKFKKSQNGVGLLAATAGAVISAKGQYKHAGCIAGSPGFLGVRKPYLIIKRPRQIMPSLYGDFRGYPTNTVMKLSDCHGYTEVDSIRLNIPNATVDEIYECETLLKEGVVFD